MSKFKVGDIIYQTNSKMGDRYKVLRIITILDNPYSTYPEVEIRIWKHTDGSPAPNKSIGSYKESMFSLDGPRYKRNLPAWW